MREKQKSNYKFKNNTVTLGFIEYSYVKDDKTYTSIWDSSVSTRYIIDTLQKQGATHVSYRKM